MKMRKHSEEIKRYELKSGEVRYMYRCHYYDSLGKRREKSKSGFTTEKAALRSLLEVKAALLSGNVKAIEKESMTVSEWLDRWFEANKPHWKISTVKQYEMFIRLHYKPILGHMRLVDINRENYQRLFINKLLETHNANSVRTFHTIFKTALNAAVEDEILIKNRVRKVKISKPTEMETEKLYYYNAKQLDEFLATARNVLSYPIYISFLLLSYTGMRRGELLALWHDDFDFTNNTITINKTRDVHGLRAPKTKNSYRIISVDPAIMREVKSYQTWTKKTTLAYGGTWSGANFAMISTVGNPLSQGALHYPLAKVQKLAGLPKIPVHGLRHTHATLLMLNPEISVKAIAERLGNTVDMIYKIYGHVLKEMSYSTMLAFSDVMQTHLDVSLSEEEA